MHTRPTLVAIALFTAIGTLSAPARAQNTGTAAPAASLASRGNAATSPDHWIEFDDETYTPVLDDVSRNIAAARAALVNKDNALAAQSITAAARALEAQADKVATLDRQQAAADMQQARDTQARLRMLTKTLDATAARIKAGQIPGTKALDQTLDKASRADLERRWLVVDAATWVPVVEEPQVHFRAAVEAFAKKDYQAAATEVRKAESYVRLEAARASGLEKKDLDATTAALEKTAVSLQKGSMKSEQTLRDTFAKANHALALAHRTKAAESWARKAYRHAGYELNAAAHGLESAAAWAGHASTEGARATLAETRAVGDKLVNGGVWAKQEVNAGFNDLGDALNKVGHALGLNAKAHTFDAGPSTPSR